MSATKDNTRADTLAILAVAGFLAALFTVMFVPVEGTSRDIMLILIGALVIIVKDVYSFEFGSSRGSREKDTKE